MPENRSWIEQQESAATDHKKEFKRILTEFRAIESGYIPGREAYGLIRLLNKIDSRPLAPRAWLQIEETQRCIQHLKDLGYDTSPAEEHLSLVMKDVAASGAADDIRALEARIGGRELSTEALATEARIAVEYAEKCGADVTKQREQLVVLERLIEEKKSKH